MTEQNKQLLLKDLCARIPYGTEISLTDGTSGTLTSISIVPHGTFITVYFSRDSVEKVLLEDVKYYLRPMSSMTKEEKSEWYSFMEKYHGIPDDTVHIQRINDYQDWLNTHHFDHRGLIPMGLALEAKEGMYKTE